MNYTPQASRQYQYLQSQSASAGLPSSYSAQKQYSSMTSGFEESISLDATTSWASCSTWPSAYNLVSHWHHAASTQTAFAERSYGSDMEFSPASPSILPSLSRDSSISPPSNPHLFTPSSSEAHLEPAIADTFADAMREFDYGIWSQPENQHNQCLQRSEIPSTTQDATNHFDFPPECVSLLNDLMQLSTQNDAVFSGLIEAQPQFASLPPSAFELDQSSHAVAEPPVLHHPRPRRPFVPRWQCDPDYDLDQFTSSFSSKSTPRTSGVALVTDTSRISYSSPTVPEDVSSDDEEDDFMDQDSDMELGDSEECEWEVHSPSPPPRSYGDAQQDYSHVVGPSVRLGASVRGLGPQALLFQSVPESVKALYSSF